ncbi:hypothetical protein K3172_09220 [Qipengyuania sp. 6B39]|uniref:hypothetical protein n=1 Tax=Qipengyuania proteolytica TaxID=2867239 RepID=UPI001C8B0227|nr:hypothetical protein [Qipengyuania proteolytica]MBX7496030.1 hypothetical protein [Qipengyuania proteolytica]
MRLAIPLLILALAACSSEPTEEEIAADVAEVEANQEPPPEQLEPQAIVYADIEKHDLFGAGCNFAPDGDTAGTIAIAMAEQGYMKKDGEILRFAADAGSPELPYLARSKYDGLAYAFRLELDEKSGMPSGDETTDYSGSLTVVDGGGREVYASTGIVQCGA